MKHILPLTLGLAALLVPCVARANDYINDPLTDANSGGHGYQGGSFGPNGWTTTGTTDAIWYEIPDALEAGSITFSVTGISIAGTLTGADHDIFAMYQAPTGQGEPVAYSPYFRNNDFKVFTRIFGQQEPGREGAMKVEFVECPRGDPWYHDEACDPSCGKNDLAYANGMDKDIGWDAAATYVINISWSNGTLAFSRDGIQLGTIPYMGTYAPQPLRVRLGSPRHGISRFAFMPIGITFKDVIITGDPGVMTPVCMPVMPDGGAPDGGGGAGGGGSSGPGELAAIQDVTGASWTPDAVFDDVTDLNPEGDGASPQAAVYLRFPQPAGVVKKALLRLRTHAFSSAAGSSGVVYSVADTTWTETTLTWSNKPPWSGAPFGTAHPVTPDTEVEWDVTELVAAGTVNFAIVSTDGDGVHYVSKEMGGPTQGPRLYIEADMVNPTGGTGAAGGGGSGNGAGGNGSGATAGSGNGAAGNGSGASAGSGANGNGPGGSGGCGCQTGSEGSAGGAAAVLGIAMLLRRRRRKVPV